MTKNVVSSILNSDDSVFVLLQIIQVEYCYPEDSLAPGKSLNTLAGLLGPMG